LTTGFDAPKTNVAIIARPTKSLVLYSQMVGRAMRGKKNGGNKECNIYTVIDNIPEFINVSHAFEYWDKSWVEEMK
jgi:superfamily II DNA or RNA helicase